MIIFSALAYQPLLFDLGIRHGSIIAGNEDNAYEIVNASQPLIEETVEAGVLGRVVAELLRTEAAKNKECGVSSSSSFAGAYLNILRQSGLTRQQVAFVSFPHHSRC